MIGGIGINDIGVYKTSVDGKHTKEYSLWKSMITRCIPGGVYQSKNPSYVGCSVHPDFIKFQDFASWCHGQIGFVDGFDLDKDILVSGNLVYGPDTCCFIPHELNSMLTHKQSNNNSYGVGVRKVGRRFSARIKLDGVDTHLGMFDSAKLASESYQVAKISAVRNLANRYRHMLDPRVYQTLMGFEME